MVPMKSIAIGCALGAAVWLAGCTNDNVDPTSDQGSTAGVVDQRSHGGTEIHTEDDCDPQDPAWQPKCNPNFHGQTLFADFRAELTATKRAAAWEYGGGQASVSSGTSVAVDNKGGETHTFTVVANYGGGRVPNNNAVSGNPVAAPECLAAASPTNVDIASGTGINVTTGASGTLKPGTYKVQCCVHPWMRTTVTVR
jgi:plastocyanin